MLCIVSASGRAGGCVGTFTLTEPLVVVMCY